MINTVAKFISILNSQAAPAQISLAFAFAMVVGLTPFFGLHNLAVFFLVLVLRVNLSAFILGTAVFSAVGYGLDPLFHVVGLKVLTLDALRDLWTWMYNTPVFRAARFNNTILMGSVAVSGALFVPFVLVANLLIRKYRLHVMGYIERTRIMKAWKATGLYRAYRGYAEIRSRL